MSDKVWSWLAIAVLVIGGFSWFAYDQNKVTCVNQAVAYTSTEQNNPNQLVGYKAVSVNGANGVNKVCSSKTQYISTTVLKAPIAQVTDIGTKQPAPAPVATPAPVSNYQAPVQNNSVRVGAICVDGWESSSTGRGTCSSHGGVSYWLYN